MGYNLPMILNSGQFHHWEEDAERYALVNGEDAFFIEAGRLVKGDAARFRAFLDEGGNYEGARRLVEGSEDLKDLAPYLPLRILRQRPWEATVGFILSANNNLLRIRRSVLDISRTFGTYLASYRGLSAYALPSPQVLETVSNEALRKLGSGYRDKYLIGSARMVASGDMDLNRPYSLPYKEAKQYVMQLPGVGPKVADCILLFGYEKADAFPVDVWIAKAMARFGDFPSREAMARYGMRRFGEHAGYIQQLLFMSQREKRSK